MSDINATLIHPTKDLTKKDKQAAKESVNKPHKGFSKVKGNRDKGIRTHTPEKGIGF